MIRKTSEVALDQVLQVFTTTDRQAVANFLNDHEAAILPLLEAPNQVAAYFPDSPLELAVITDPDAVGACELFIYIHTSLPVAEALDQLDQLDTEWLMQADRRSGGLLNVNLRFT